MVLLVPVRQAGIVHSEKGRYGIVHGGSLCPDKRLDAHRGIRFAGYVPLDKWMHCMYNLH